MPARDSLPPVSLDRQLRSFGGVCFLVLTAAYVGSGVWLMHSVGFTDLKLVARWYDPLFFQYNLAMLLVAQLFVPAVTLMYVMRMRNEKTVRLRRELPDAVWWLNRDEILARIESHFRFGNYFGRALLLTVVISLGAMILLLKPEFLPPPETPPASAVPIEAPQRASSTRSARTSCSSARPSWRRRVRRSTTRGWP